MAVFPESLHIDLEPNKLISRNNPSTCFHMHCHCPTKSVKTLKKLRKQIRHNTCRFFIRHMPSVLWRCWWQACKNWEWLAQWSVWRELQICIWLSWRYCHSLSLASVKSRLVLPFWYQLTRVVQDKGLLNARVCVFFIRHMTPGRSVLVCLRCDASSPDTTNSVEATEWHVTRPWGWVEYCHWLCAAASDQDRRAVPADGSSVAGVHPCDPALLHASTTTPYDTADFAPGVQLLPLYWQNNIKLHGATNKHHETCWKFLTSCLYVYNDVLHKTPCNPENWKCKA